MGDIRIGNHPCSWGVAARTTEGMAEIPPYGLVLDEMEQTGYAGTELGFWGFLPTDPRTLRDELAHRGLDMVGGLVTVRLADSAAHTEGLERVLRTASLVADSGGPGAFLLLADEHNSNPTRKKLAGRIEPGHALSGEQWSVFADGAQRIAQSVKERTGLRTAFHHHCAGFVETPYEIETFLSLTDPGLIGLCLDTGHYQYGGGDALAAVRRYTDRIWHVHFKACSPEVVAQARVKEWDYVQAVAGNVFCELDQGTIDFEAIIQELHKWNYQGWVVVEQDVLPGMGTPKESARRNRDYLRKILNDDV